MQTVKITKPHKQNIKWKQNEMRDKYQILKQASNIDQYGSDVWALLKLSRSPKMDFIRITAGVKLRNTKKLEDLRSTLLSNTGSTDNLGTHAEKLKVH